MPGPIWTRCSASENDHRYRVAPLNRQPARAGVLSMDWVSGDRELDVVVFGATGFVGRLVAGYLADHAPPGVRIGLAGRSGRRLADVRARLGRGASAWPGLVGGFAGPAALAALARGGREGGEPAGTLYRVRV